MKTRRQIFQRLSGFRGDHEGGTVIIFAIALPVVIGALALGSEYGHYRFMQARLQNAADMAALAGAYEYKLTDSESGAKTAAKGEAHENGFSLSTGTATVYSPIQTGAFAGEEGVEITLSLTADRYFSKIFKSQSLTLNSRAVAKIVAGEPACLLALDPSASGAITASGSTSVQVDGCAVHANSTSNSAFDMKGSSSFDASCVSTAGGASTNGNLTMSNCASVQTNSLEIKNPYESVKITDTVSSMPCLSPVKNGNTYELSSGRYCSYLKINGDIVLLDDGPYYFDGADLQMNSSGSSLTGTNVTLVFMNDGELKNANGGDIDITAPTSGNFKGIVIYGDPDTNNSSKKITINGNQDARIEGVVYYPENDVKFNGGANMNSSCTHVVANTIEFTGNSGVINDNCDSYGVLEMTAASGIALVQ